MKVNTYTPKPNTGELCKTGHEIEIKCGRWIDHAGYSSSMKFEKVDFFVDRNVYALYLSERKNSKCTHIKLSFWQKQRFLFMQRCHWLQKEENIRYIINLLFLLGGLILGFLNYFNT